MDWSPDTVLDYRARTHERGLRWSRKRWLLWPVWAWRVVVPTSRNRNLNPVQRAVLRLHIAGVNRFDVLGELLDLDKQLMAYVVAELQGMSLLDERSSPTERANRFLEEAEQDPDALEVGWVYQCTHTGKLLPRFVTDQPAADTEADESGRPLITVGSKGKPSTDGGFIVRQGRAPKRAPSPRDILDAHHRHKRHLRRAHRAGMEPGLEASQLVGQVSRIAEAPQLVHLMTFVYVPESMEEEFPWYVAEPFGFGADRVLRDQLDRIRRESSGGLRDMLDDITGASMEKYREGWEQMQLMLRDEARNRALEALPRGWLPDDDEVRARLEDTFVDIVRLEQQEQTGRLKPRSIDAAYLHLRQSIEVALVLLWRRYRPADAASKIKRAQGPAIGAIIRACAEATGFDAGKIPRPITKAKAGTIGWLSRKEPSSQLRPALATFLLNASGVPEHPLRAVAAADPDWLVKVSSIADHAGGQVHSSSKKRTLEELNKDAQLTIQVLRTLLKSIAEKQVGRSDV